MEIHDMASNTAPPRPHSDRKNKGKGREQPSHRTSSRLDDAEDTINERLRAQEADNVSMEERILTNLAGEQETIAHAKAKLKKFDARCQRNFPVQMVKWNDGECFMTRDSAPVSYVIIAAEVVRRADPENVEITVYAPTAAPTLELVNLEMVYGDFPVDGVVNDFVQILQNAGLSLKDRFIKSQRLVDRKVMLHHRAMTFFVLANHPFWEANPDQHAILRNILEEFYDRLYSNRIERLMFGYSVELGKAGLTLGNCLTYPNYTTMNHMRTEHADRIGAENWEKLKALCKGDALGEDVKEYGWSY